MKQFTSLFLSITIPQFQLGWRWENREPLSPQLFLGESANLHPSAVIKSDLLDFIYIWFLRNVASCFGRTWLTNSFFQDSRAESLGEKKQESPTSSQWNKQICFWCYENTVGMVNITNIKYLAILCDLFGMVKWALQRLSDLQLGDKKVTLKHLVNISWSLSRPYHGFLNAIKRCRHHKTVLYDRRLDMVFPPKRCACFGSTIPLMLPPT